LLISLCFAAQAQELEFSHSGFATYTYVQQDTFYPSKGLIAENLNAEYGQWALRAQITSKPNVISRAAIEYAIPEYSKNIAFQFGRVPRLTTFFSDSFGNPGERGMAVLPLASYNRRKVHNISFNSLDGARVQANYVIGGNSTQTTLAGGSLGTEDDCITQMEFTSRPCTPDYKFKGIPGSYSCQRTGLRVIGLQYCRMTASCLRAKPLATQRLWRCSLRHATHRRLTTEWPALV